MTQIILAFSELPRPEFDNTDPNGSSQLTISADEILNDQSHSLKTIKFNIVDNKYSHIFLDQWERTKTVDNKRSIIYNIYEEISKEQLVVNQKEMLATIETITKNWPEYPIPDDIVIVVDENDQQLSKLNALHEYFEDTSHANNSSEKNIELYNLLERINYLVHKMESGTNTSPKRHTVIRADSRILQEHYRLTTEDYANFEAIQSGVLYIDFATVGKDFHTCRTTNDIELVKLKKVSPQEFILPSMFFTVEHQGRQNEEFYKERSAIMKKFSEYWVDENNLSEYIDVNDPKHTYGRIRLGEPVNEITIDQLTDINSTHPYLYGAYIDYQHSH